jgi:hypothetical protein
MIAKCLFAAALAAMVLPGAANAADLGEGIYTPPSQANAWCVPPGTPKIYHRRLRGQNSKPLRYLAPEADVQIYVEPRVAFIVSDPCPNQYRQNWYEGKIWYYNAGSPQGPDTFRIARPD